MSDPPSNRGNRGGANRGRGGHAGQSRGGQGRGGQGRGGQGRGDQGRGGHRSQDQTTSQPPAGPSRGRGRGGGAGQRDGSPAPRGGPNRGGRGGAFHDAQTRGGYQGGNTGRGAGRQGGRGGNYQAHDQSRSQRHDPPDETITQLEDRIIASLSDPIQDVTAKAGKMALENSQATDAITLPIRPSYGTKGIPAILTANYFDLRINGPRKLYLYTLDVRYSTGPRAENEVVGRLRSIVVRTALARLNPRGPWASEFKSQVVSLKMLDLPKDHVLRFQLPSSGHAQGPGQGPEYTVKFTSLQELDPQHLLIWLGNMQENDEKFPKYQSIINALDVIIGHTPREAAGVTAVGRSRFFQLGGRDEQALGEKLKIIIRGFFQSVRPATGRLLLNVNVTHGIFRNPGNLDERLKDWGLNRMTDLDQGNDHTNRFFEKKLRTYSTLLSKTRVQYKQLDDQGPPRIVEKTIIGFAVRGDKNSQDPTKPPKFAHRYGSPYQTSFYIGPPGSQGSNWNPGSAISPDGYITVADYYKKRYGYETSQHLPLVNIGTAKRTVYVPAELCTIVAGQPLRGQLTGAEAQQMITFACRKPFQNETSILRESRGVLSLNNNARLNAFGITIGQQLLTVHARVLPVPKISYRSSNFQPQNASWNLNNHLVAKSGPEIKHFLWFYVVQTRQSPVPEGALKPLTPVIKRFLEFWKSKVGIAISTDPKNGAVLNVREGSIERDIHEGILSQLKRRDIPPTGTPPLAFFVVPDRDNTDIYRAIKLAGDIKLGIHTVCALEKNVKSATPGYMANVGLKVNLKAGGINHKFALDLDIVRNGTTMFVGYDVIHPTNLSIKAENATSQVGLVISVDQELSQWPAIAWNQGGGVEMLGPSLTEKFVGRLDLWSRRNDSKLPENIVIFRDGVSEGQFEQVITKELPSIRAAYAQAVSQRKLDSGKTARISIIVSVKRHQTRFYPTSTEQNVTLKNGNVMNGTVVDRGVTSARYWDFFLTAHAAIQGTARPARYTVIYDEMFEPDHGKDAADVLEKLTHEMCYLYGRATKAVSICPPAYYADIVCTRARLHHQDQFESSTAGSSVSGQKQTSQQVVDRPVHSRIADTMYYV